MMGMRRVVKSSLGRKDVVVRIDLWVMKREVGSNEFGIGLEQDMRWLILGH